MSQAPFPLLLALRLTRTASHERSLSTMLLLCFWGICISTCALAVVAAVMRGLERVTHANIQGVHADLMIRSSRPVDYEKINQVLTKEFADTVQAASPSNLYHVVVTDKKNEQFALGFMMAFDPETITQVNTLHSYIIAPTNASLSQLVQHNDVLVGKLLAENVQLTVGNPLAIMFPTEQQTKRNRLTFDTIDARVGGIFATGIDEYDSQAIFASYQFIEEQLSLPKTVTTIHLKLKPGANSSKVQQQLRARFGLPVLSWKELYPPLMSALTLEKYAMIFILSLIVLIASMNTISLLFMFITHKKRMIALLYAMGMSKRAITTAFVTFGTGLTAFAASVGLACAICICYLLEHYRLIPLPDAYYASYLPAHMNATIALSVLALVILGGFISAWYPTRSLNRKRITHTLKFDM
jgi:lipoprotein-releasing system permease protein